MPEDKVIYLTEKFEPVEKDDPRMKLVKVIGVDGSMKFGIVKKRVQNKIFHFGGSELKSKKLFEQGGLGSGDFGHSGRPGKVGGSSGNDGTKHFTEVDFTDLYQELSVEGRDAVQEYTFGNMSQDVFVSIMRKEEYISSVLQDRLRVLADDSGYVTVYRGGQPSNKKFSNGTLDIEKAKIYASGFTGLDIGTVTEYEVPLDNFFAYGSSGEQEVFFKMNKQVKAKTIRGN